MHRHLNRHCGTIIPGNHNKVSHAGRLLLDFLQEDEFTLVNALERTINGPFTLYDVNDTENYKKVCTRPSNSVNKSHLIRGYSSN